MMRRVFLAVLGALLLSAVPASAQSPAPLEQFVRRVGYLWEAKDVDHLVDLVTEAEVPGLDAAAFPLQKSAEENLDPLRRRRAERRAGLGGDVLDAAQQVAGGRLFHRRRCSHSLSAPPFVYDSAGSRR